MSENLSFDSGAPRIFNLRPGGSHHVAYRDAAGSICIVAQSRLPGGGCAISAKAIDWAQSREEPVFIRLMNKSGRLDVTLPLASIPLGEVRNGRFGEYYAVDLNDLRGPDFPPPLDFGNDDDDLPF